MSYKSLRKLGQIRKFGYISLRLIFVDKYQLKPAYFGPQLVGKSLSAVPLSNII